MDRIPRTVTITISAITALAWVIAALFDPTNRVSYWLGFIPARFNGLVTLHGAAPTFLTPLTATLVHGGLVHLAFNLLIFIWCGAQVERVLGRVGIIILYVAGAYASALLQWAVSPTSIVPMVGASGAISAVIGAFALSFGRAKAFTSNLRLNRWINVAWLMIAWIILETMMGWLGNQRGYLLATPAHIGGFAAGLLLQRSLLLFHYRKA